MAAPLQYNTSEFVETQRQLDSWGPKHTGEVAVVEFELFVRQIAIGFWERAFQQLPRSNADYVRRKYLKR